MTTENRVPVNRQKYVPDFEPRRAGEQEQEEYENSKPLCFGDIPDPMQDDGSIHPRMQYDERVYRFRNRLVASNEKLLGDFFFRLKDLVLMSGIEPPKEGYQKSRANAVRIDLHNMSKYLMGLNFKISLYMLLYEKTIAEISGEENIGNVIQKGMQLKFAKPLEITSMEMQLKALSLKDAVKETSREAQDRIFEFGRFILRKEQLSYWEAQVREASSDYMHFMAGAIGATMESLPTGIEIEATLGKPLTTE